MGPVPLAWTLAVKSGRSVTWLLERGWGANAKNVDRVLPVDLEVGGGGRHARASLPIFPDIELGADFLALGFLRLKRIRRAAAVDLVVGQLERHERGPPAPP